MVDREKILHGLNSCGNDDGHPDRCGRTECPYRDNGAWCTHELAHDAEVLVSALLKSQCPRLMTLEEILSSDGAVWILDNDDKGCEIHIAFPLRKMGELDPVIEFRSKEPDMLEHRLIRDYLLGWCCWTSRPTDEQRKAVKWND